MTNKEKSAQAHSRCPGGSRWQRPDGNVWYVYGCALYTETGEAFVCFAEETLNPDGPEAMLTCPLDDFLAMGYKRLGDDPNPPVINNVKGGEAT